MSGRTLRRIGIAAALAVMVFCAWELWGSPDLASLIDRDALEALVAEADAAGPVLVIGLMALAIVASPIPSAPIAVASGAALRAHLGHAAIVLVRAGSCPSSRSMQ